MLFDKEGILNIDELVAQRPTFRKIMEDQINTACRRVLEAKRHRS